MMTIIGIVRLHNGLGRTNPLPSKLMSGSAMLQAVSGNVRTWIDSIATHPAYEAKACQRYLIASVRPFFVSSWNIPTICF